MEFTLCGLTNKSLWEIFLLAAKYNIAIKFYEIKSSDNGLADAFSQKNSALIANLCLHWQAPLNLILFFQNFCTLFLIWLTLQKLYFNTAWYLKRDEGIIQPFAHISSFFFCETHAWLTTVVRLIKYVNTQAFSEDVPN